MSEDANSSEEQIREVLRGLFGEAANDIPSEELSKMKDFAIDPGMLQAMVNSIKQASANAETGATVDWALAERQAQHIAAQHDQLVSLEMLETARSSFALSELWLSEATVIPALTVPPKALTRSQWVTETMPAWREIAEPVALNITRALSEALSKQLPEEISNSDGANPGKIIAVLGSSAFASQLGAIVGKLSTEVLSGSDVSLPVAPIGEAILLPQNFADIAKSLEIPEDQFNLFISSRELAYARLFRHAKWLRLLIFAQLREFANGIEINTEAIEEVALSFDPGEPDSLQTAIESGAFLPKRTSAQESALSKLEDLVAAVDGWVDVVTTDASGRIPEISKISESVRRRRASGGPAENALGALVGMQIRPKRIREAAAMWRKIGDEVGVVARDSLWDYPDLIPSGSDIDDPSSLIQRLQAFARGDAPETDSFDDALAALLDEESGSSQSPDQDDLNQ